MNKSDSYFRQLDQAEARADEARFRYLRHRMGIKVEYIMRWYRDTDGDVIAPDNRESR